jgi:hypothetical protein
MDDLPHIRDLLLEARDLMAPRTTVGSSQIVVHAGGIGVWIAATAAVLCLFAVLVLTVLYVDQARQIDDLNHYLQAIYAQAPHLKPTED